jgi:hypothetical protein
VMQHPTAKEKRKSEIGRRRKGNKSLTARSQEEAASEQRASERGSSGRFGGRLSCSPLLAVGLCSLSFGSLAGRRARGSL